MSGASRWILGAFALLFGTMFVYTARNSSASWIDLGLAAFCLAIAVACFSKKGRGPAIKFIGVTVFLAYLIYFGWEIATNFSKPYTGRAEEHWLNALIGLFAFGLPGLYVLIKGVYPRWGIRSDVFRGNDPISAATDETDKNHQNP
jgi:hypothetical protein